MRPTRLTAAAVLSLCTVAAGQATAPSPDAPATTTRQPPKYLRVRYDEDYSYLKNPAYRTDYLDALKYIPLGDPDGDAYLSLGGHTRYRYEYFHDLNFGAGTQDPNGFHLTRFFAHADLHLSPYFRALVEGKTVMEDGREPGPRNSDADEADLQQLFADLTAPITEKHSLTLRLGRQDLFYGAQRLIAPADWGNARRTFEGAKLIFASPNNTLDAFWVRPVATEREEPNTGEGEVSFSGLYNTTKLHDFLGAKANSRLEVYALALNESLGGAGDTDTYTVGARLSSLPRPWDFDVEGGYQFGQAGPEGTISAWFGSVEGGYTFANVAYHPRPFIGFDVGSGDRDPSDPDKQTFNQLFALGHASYGFEDLVGRQNAMDLHPGLELFLLENRPFARALTLRTDYHIFWRTSTEDGIYDKAGRPFRGDNGSDASFIGSELDLLLTWQVDRHLNFYFGYSHFFAGTFLEETGAHEDVDYFYAAATFMF